MQTEYLAVLLALGSVIGWPSGSAGGSDHRPRAPVVLISVDGLKPDYVLAAEQHGLKIPNLRRLAAEGAFATGVIGVTPTVTYPAHTTMVTGVSPAKHGILTNTPFDPLGQNLGGWYWYAEDIRVPTLWDAAAKAKLVTSSVDWPVTVGASISHNIAQYWRASTADDHKILRAVSTRGLVAEVEAVVGAYPQGNDYTIAADRRRAAFNAVVLETKKPHFHLCYFSGLDTEEHRSGPYSSQTFAVLEETDELVGEVWAAAEKVGGGQAVLCLVSDHGFCRTDKELHLNAAFVQAGLIELNQQGRPRSWQAFAWYPSGSAGIMLQDPKDETVRGQVRKVLAQLAEDPEAGIDRVLEEEEIPAFEGFSGAAFLVSMRPGYRLGANLKGPVKLPGKLGGTHGYLPNLTEMDAAFFLVAPGVSPGLNLGRIDMRDIAPTLAGFLGVELPTADGRDLIKSHRLNARER